jgi:cytidylate kinase
MSIITISRGTFSGGQILAECVAKKLGYSCISREVLVAAARGHGVPLEELTKALNEPPGGLFHRKTLNRVHYLVYIREALVKSVKDEKAVYHGLSGQLLLTGVPHVLRVFVIASMEYRIQAAIERLHCNRSKAIEFIHNIDKKRDNWVRFLYNVDRHDPSLYDLIINLDRMDIDSACEIICASASQQEFQTTPESQKRLSDLVLAAEIRSMIASDGSIDDDNIEVEADDGVIILQGMAHSLADADKIREVVRRRTDIKDMKSEMHVKV